MINEKNMIQDPASLKKQFQNDKTADGPYIYLPLDSAYNNEEKLSHLISGYKKSGFCGVIPFTNSNYEIQPLDEEYFETYDIIENEVKENSLKIGYLDDIYVMQAYLSSLRDSSSAVCPILTKYEYTCVEGQVMKKKLREQGKLMSVVAVNDDDLTVVDLRPYLEDNTIDWTVPDGNWNIEEYRCEPDLNSKAINLLDYDISMEYLRSTFGKLCEKYAAEKDEVPPFNIFIYRNVMYTGQNRRAWHVDFNEEFEKEYGFDPSPYYTLLFRDYGGNSARYKSMLMNCRANMLISGYLKACSDFCMAKGVFCTGFPAESKATACSWLFGDGQLLHKYASAPGISMPFAYLYGLNGVKVAAGAADSLGHSIVTADLFNYYDTLSRDIIYRESMNAFVRGVNMVFVHLGEDRAQHSSITEKDDDSPIWGSIFSKGDDLTEYASFVSRVQTVLGGGEHICENAIIYPIHSLHSFVGMYQSSSTEGFEYPSTPENADYMEMMNSFLNYVGEDSVFVHPTTLIERSFVENGVLYVNNDSFVMKFRTVIMPSMSIISIKALRVIKKFFDEGGKIIATDNLPTASCDCSVTFTSVDAALKTKSPEDEEVINTIKYIFGEDVLDNRIIKRYYKNDNENGGMAYYLPSNKRSVDGTDSVSADILAQAMNNFDLAPDVYIDKRPRREMLGFVNYHLPAFIKIGVDKRLANGCSMNCLHKRYAGCDIYYITNTTGEKYAGKLLLRGYLAPEEWNPYNGKIKKAPSENVRFRGQIYTMMELELEASSGTFIVSPVQRTQKELSRDLTDEDDIPNFYPTVLY